MNGRRLIILVAIITVIGIAILGMLTGNKIVVASLWLICPVAYVYLLMLVLRGCRSRIPESGKTPGTSTALDWCLWFLFAFLSVFLVFGSLPMISSGREPHRRMACSNNLKQIGFAMQAYSTKYGCYPPAYAVDHKGRPTVSWRVLLLPFFCEREEGEKVYGSIRIDEPWDSPHNRAATANKTVANFFHCPTATSPQGETNYAMAIGTDTISDGSHSTQPGDIKEGSSHVIAVVEVLGTGINWAEPRDLDFKTMSFRVNDLNGKGISSAHAGGANVLFTDGSVRFISSRTDPKVIKAALTLHGGKDAGELDRY
jgi:prepilin-type processing-associated H-X9-DG protein